MCERRGRRGRAGVGYAGDAGCGGAGGCCCSGSRWCCCGGEELDGAGGCWVEGYSDGGVLDRQIVLVGDIVGGRPSEQVVWREDLTEERGKRGGGCDESTESEEGTHVFGGVWSSLMVQRQYRDRFRLSLNSLPGRK